MRSISTTVVGLLTILFFVDVNAKLPATVGQLSLFSSGDSSRPEAPDDRKADNISIDDRVARLERIFSAGSKSQIRIQRQLDSLSDQVASLNGKEEQQQHQIELIVKQERDIYQEIEHRFAQFKVQQLPVSSEGQVIQKDGQASYEAAVELVMKDHQFVRAISEFQRFLVKYPKSDYVPNANYWLGQLEYTQGKKARAIQYFNTVVTKYPRSNKVPESLLKIGQISLQQNNLKDANSYFTQVVHKYPSSSASALAKLQLSKMSAR